MVFVISTRRNENYMRDQNKRREEEEKKIV
jgi:hypothetical protein